MSATQVYGASLVCAIGAVEVFALPVLVAVTCVIVIVAFVIAVWEWFS